MWIRPGSSARTGATFLRYRSAEVTSTRPSPRAMRWRTGSGPNALKRGENTQRALNVPIMATYSQGTRPTRLNTLSPGARPRPRNPWANAEVRAERSP